MQINIGSSRKFRSPKIRPSRAPVHSQFVVIDSGRHSRNNGNGTVSKRGGRKIGKKITAGVNATAANGPAAACSLSMAIDRDDHLDASTWRRLAECCATIRGPYDGKQTSTF